jgi:16S rRNA (cytosine1402-N4)-methyltransferase
MTQPTPQESSYHIPVMVEEAVAWLETAADGWIVDATFGGGGHSHALLDRYPNLRIIGIDRDPDAVEQAFVDDRLTVVQANYRDVESVLGTNGLPCRVDGILLDLGVSSHQLDVADRGFSYHSSGPLDMRMGPDAQRSAADIVNSLDAVEITRILRTYGEEKFAKRIADAIVAGRPFEDTTDLASCIAEAVPAAARRARHPARRSFQAIRMAVNEELDGLRGFLDTGLDRLDEHGRIVVMAYHSLEDRMVKRAFVERSRDCTCPPEIPVCVCGADPDLRVLTRKAIKPTAVEIEANPRSRSAVLRVAERIRT